VRGSGDGQGQDGGQPERDPDQHAGQQHREVQTDKRLDVATHARIAQGAHEQARNENGFERQRTGGHDQDVDQMGGRRFQVVHHGQQRQCRPLQGRGAHTRRQTAGVDDIEVEHEYREQKQVGVSGHGVPR